MSSTSHNSNPRIASRLTASSAEETLQLIARLPAPEGLEDRVKTGLKTAPRAGRILHWPASLRPTASWVRGAAAAAVVFVVAGGGWGIYMRVQPTQPARVLVMPHAGGGFSSAGAMRTPQTLNGPILAQPLNTQMDAAETAKAQPVQITPLMKVPAKVVPMTRPGSNAVAGNKSSAQPAVSIAK
jgi:hypothetical protein